MLKRKMAKIGDVFQLLTTEGICYGQVIHKDQKYGFIGAIFREFFEDEPENFEQIVAQEPQIITPFLINTSLSQGIVSIVANVPIAEKLQKFPIFRATNNLNIDVPTWFFWDGVREWKETRLLTEAEKKYPEGPSFFSAPLIIEMIENNYRVEKDYI
jgi:Immunity protein 26